jgi:2-iminobutanoate/2-iminopropanoate deaminase
MKVENIVPAGHKSESVYTPVKKIDIGNGYWIFLMGVQPPKEACGLDIARQTESVFEKIRELLALAGADFNNVVKAVIYLTDMDDSGIVSSIRNEHFKISKPVSTMIEAGRLKRDGAKIEIEVTAVLDK